MSRTLTYTLAASFFLISHVSTLAATAETSHTKDNQLTIRIWDLVQADSETWNHTMAAVEGVFRPSGINLIWLHCAVDDTPENLACSSPTGPNDISLRIYRRTKADFKIKSHSKGGFSLLLSPEGGKGIIHVFFDRMTEVSQSHKVPLELVLGITVAHEIGHLLLPHQPHALAGIMRAELDSADWRLAAQGWLGFTDGQKEIITAGLQARSLKVVQKWLTTSLGFQVSQDLSETSQGVGNHTDPSLLPDPSAVQWPNYQHG
jgi:hypothetical protein